MDKHNKNNKSNASGMIQNSKKKISYSLYIVYTSKVILTHKNVMVDPSSDTRNVISGYGIQEVTV